MSSSAPVSMMMPEDTSMFPTTQEQGQHYVETIYGTNISVDEVITRLFRFSI
jgi:hypothetical protein